MKEKIKIGYIGLGRRGMRVLKLNLVEMRDVAITTVCDLSESRCREASEIILEKTGIEPKITNDYREMLRDPDIDAVFIMSGWDGRPEMAIEFMKAGKYTAIEVGCSRGLDVCFELVKTYEETSVPVMMLENCCYGRREMMLLNMVKKGLFGELVHCSGGYHHYLNDVELFKDIGKEEIPHYRLSHYRDTNRENYPTHELGPISKLLNINRGNRFVSLASFGTKSAGIKAYAAEHFGTDSPYATADYKQSDIVTTLLTCAGGETVRIELDTTLPRAYYSRGITVRGTRGMSSEDARVVFLEGMEEEIRDNEEQMYEKYDHPLHAEYVKTAPKGDHDGIDWLVCRAFIESVKNGTDTPIDAYDTATWLAIGALSEKSLANGGAVVEFPDFTGGKWENREPIVKCKYCLSDIVTDESTPIM